MMEAWNTELFLMLNAAAVPMPIVVLLARSAAQLPVYVATALTPVIWIRGTARDRGVLLAVGLGLLLALFLSLMINLFWYVPRPFVLGVGHSLLTHSAETSFPSDHATFLWTLGLGLIATKARVGLGRIIVVAGFATAWARIYLGIHWPLDMLGSFVVALASAGAAWALLPSVQRFLLPRIQNLYEWLLQAFRLPPSIFPRRVE